MLVDSHCHLDFDGLAGDIDAVLARARNAGIGALQTISTRLTTFERVRAIAEAHDDVWCSVGVHPHNAGEEGQAESGKLVELAAHPKVIGIGESGLDYFYDNAPRDRQAESFHAHCDAARRTGLPLIVHTRDADEDTIAILHEEYAKGAFPGLIHCYSTSPWLADKAMEIGFSISFSGIVTFKNSTELQDTAKRLPMDRILVETDAPFLAPVPKRGKPNEPSYVAHTAGFVAGLRGMDPDEFAAATTDNFYRLFSRATPPAAV